MATKSFLKNITIKDKKSAISFISALENAENKGRKTVVVDKKVTTVKDKGAIKNIFGV